MLCRELRAAIVGMLLNGLAGSHAVPRPLRFVLYRAFGLRLGTWRISSGCVFGGIAVTVGRGSMVNYGCFFDAAAPISVGERCHLAQQVMILTSAHEPGVDACRAGTLAARPVTIGDGCWIGARATILPGVKVGSGCVVAAGAVVTSDCLPNGLYAGVPAKRVRELS